MKMVHNLDYVDMLATFHALINGVILTYLQHRIDQTYNGAA